MLAIYFATLVNFLYGIENVAGLNIFRNDSIQSPWKFRIYYRSPAESSRATKTQLRSKIFIVKMTFSIHESLYVPTEDPRCGEHLVH